MSYDYEASSTTETLTEWMMRFDSVWDVDFEFNEDGNHHPVPLCMYARERLSGTEIVLWRDQLRKCRQAPFGTGPRDLMISYASNVAEMSAKAICRHPDLRQSISRLSI